jgi:hypothetical protein
MPEVRLTEEQKMYIVRRLAAHDPLAVIVRGLEADFGITVSSGMIQHYDPERFAGRHLAPRLKELFWKTRQEFIDGTADIGGKYPLVRIHWRAEMARENWVAGKHSVANDLLDSIAKEAVGVPDESKTDGHFGLRGGPLTATVTIVHRDEPAREPELTPAARKPRDQDT